MTLVEHKLSILGLKLFPPKAHAANYLGSKQISDLLFVSGRKSELTGAVDSDVAESQAKLAAKETVLLILSIVKEDIDDLDLIEGVVKMQGFIRSSESFIR